MSKPSQTTGTIQLTHWLLHLKCLFKSEWWDGLWITSEWHHSYFLFLESIWVIYTFLRICFTWSFKIYWHEIIHTNLIFSFFFLHLSSFPLIIVLFGFSVYLIHLVKGCQLYHFINQPISACGDHLYCIFVLSFISVGLFCYYVIMFLTPLSLAFFCFSFVLFGLRRMLTHLSSTFPILKYNHGRLQGHHVKL